MDSWIGVMVMVAAWIAIQAWVLPRLGVPT